MNIPPEPNYDESLRRPYVPNFRRICPDPDEDYIDEEHDIEITFPKERKKDE